MFVDCDMSLIEINPLIITSQGHLHCLDAKVNLDSNALFRHSNLANMRDLSQEDPQESEASNHDLSYVSLDGNIGCMVNGAGQQWELWILLSSMEVSQQIFLMWEELQPKRELQKLLKLSLIHI